MKLWITEVDGSGKPLTDQVVFEGPTITVPFGDGVHPIRIQYTFDPPVVLPGRRQYFFAVQEQCSGWFDLLVTDYDAYPGGSLWRTGRSLFSGCILRIDPNDFYPRDLVFTIEFCRPDAVTPVRQESWGELKVIYR